MGDVAIAEAHGPRLPDIEALGSELELVLIVWEVRARLLLRLLPPDCNPTSSSPCPSPPASPVRSVRLLPCSHSSSPLALSPLFVSAVTGCAGDAAPRVRGEVRAAAQAAGRQAPHPRRAYHRRHHSNTR